MCLKSTKFALDYDSKSRKFIGYGWRCMYVSSEQYQWQKAQYHNAGKPHKIGCDNGKDTYIPGFHIFVNRKDAVKYAGGDDTYIVKVAYRNVIAFGSQTTSSSRALGDCIIAQEMKVIGPAKQ
jgi:hypothetical protein